MVPDVVKMKIELDGTERADSETAQSGKTTTNQKPQLIAHTSTLHNRRLGHFILFAVHFTSCQ